MGLEKTGDTYVPQKPRSNLVNSGRPSTELVVSQYAHYMWLSIGQQPKLKSAEKLEKWLNLPIPSSFKGKVDSIECDLFDL